MIRGWGATHLLREVPHAVSIRVCAPFELRKRRMMERLSSESADQVADEIRMNDEAHGAIVRRHFDLNWSDSEHYDLVLNTERLTIEECADEVMGLLDDATFQETPQSQRAFSNLALAAHIRSALRQDPRTAKMMISITCEDGVATLAGLVDPGQQPKDAADVASRVPGVKEVKSQLRSVASGARHHVED